MDADRYAQIKAHFLDLSDLPAGEREAGLAAVPDGLRDEVRAMLDADGSGGGFLDPETRTPVLAAEDPMLGAEVGAFRIERLLGEGGMGRVYAASRADGAFEQTVALKLVKRGMDTAAVLRRFEAERRILARLRHPGIARLVDGGETDDGRPYVAMELVDGEKLTAYADRYALGVDDRVRLMVQVCDAVAHAHRRLVVHRDLKPSNILVETDPAGRPTVKLLDFGIARLLEGDDDGLTATGQRLMTRPYAAPEQIRGDEVTTATDVWALGVLLYRLLAGRRPFEADSRAGLETAILEDTPTLPSVAASRLEPTTEGASTGTGTGTSTSAGAARRLRGDLDAVCLTALAKEPERRYPTADAFAADLRRFLDDLPVEARPPAASYRIRKFVARHRAAVAVALGALVLLVGGAALYTARLQAERDRAEGALAEAEATADFLSEVFVAGDPFDQTRRDTLSLDGVLDASLALIGERLDDAPAVQGRLYTRVAVAYAAQGRHAEADSLFRLAHERLGGAWTQARATALKRHADLLIRRGGAEDLELAADHYRRVASFYDRHYGPDHPGTAGILGSLAMTLLRAGAPDEADGFFQESLRRYTSRDTLDTTAYSAVLGQRALLLNDRGDGDGAMRALEESLRLNVEQLGPTHPRTAVKHYHIGSAHATAGRYDEAVAAFERSYAIDAAELGPDHPNALNARRRIGGVRAEQGRTAEGVALLREALARLEATQPPTFPLVPAYRVDLAKALLAAGETGEAREALAAALPPLREAHGDDHVKVAQAEALLGEAALAEGDARAAVSALRGAVATLASGYPPTRPEVLRARDAYARALVAAGRPADAVAPLQGALAATETRFGPDHPRTQALRRRLAALQG